MSYREELIFIQVIEKNSFLYELYKKKTYFHVGYREKLIFLWVIERKKKLILYWL